jgi:hypothetical protein
MIGLAIVVSFDAGSLDGTGKGKPRAAGGARDSWL